MLKYKKAVKISIKQNPILMENKWHTKSIIETTGLLNSGEHGLSQKEAEKRLKEQGLNKLPEAKVPGIAIIFLRQFQSPLIYILFTAAIILFVMNEIVDSYIIFGVLIFNAIVGAIQEGRAQNTLLALRKFVET